jgi:hypothetical protein
MELPFDTQPKGDGSGGIMVIEEQQEELPLFESRPFYLPAGGGPRLDTPRVWLMDRWILKNMPVSL